MAMNSSPSPSLRSSYQVAASSSSASASASSASLTTCFQARRDAFLDVGPVDQSRSSVRKSLGASIELVDPSVLRASLGTFVKAEQEVLRKRGALVDRQGEGFSFQAVGA